MAKRRRRFSRATALLAGSAIALVAAGMIFADAGSLNVEVFDKDDYAIDHTNENAIVEYFGSTSPEAEAIGLGSSGSGVFDSFVRIEGQGLETAGFNTNATPTLDTKAGAFTKAIKVSDIPVVSVGGDPYWELWADINEANSDSARRIALNDVEIFFTNSATLTGYPFATPPAGVTASKVYDFEGFIAIYDVNAGSGEADLRYQVPLDNITIPDNCSYKNPLCATYFVLYSEWGAPSGAYVNDSGFEEWKVREYPYVSVTKTADETFTRTFPWTIEKSVTPESWDLFTGESGTSEYTVELTKGDGVDSDWAVSGTITIENVSDADTVVESVTDVISGFGPVAVDCGADFPIDLDEGDTLECTYSTDLGDGADRTNTAEVELDYGGIFQGTAPVTFGAPTTLVDDTVDVTDTNGMSWDDVADDDEFTYTRTFDCDADEGEHDNTATIVQTGQSDDATVTVSCHEIEVTKDAETSLQRTFLWDIDKSVSPATWDLFTGDSGTSEWTVDVDQTGYTDAEFAVTGTITVANNTPIDATINSVSDAITGGVTADVECTGITFPYTLVAGGSFTCDYDATLDDDTERTNTATAVRQNYDYDEDEVATASDTADITGQATVDFSGAVVTNVNDTVDVTDTNGMSWNDIAGDDSFSYSETFTCDADEGDHLNTATITQTGQDADATATVNCHEIEVTKDADTSFTRTFHWTIDKSSDDPNGGALTLNPGTIYADYPYEITVDLDDPAYTDSDWAVEGEIDIHNPAPIDAVINSVSDVLTPAGAANVDCEVTFPYTLLAGATLTCTYDKDLDGAVDQENEATATRQNYDYDKDENATPDGTTDVSGSASATFGDPTTLVDDNIHVVDDNGTPGDTSDDHDFGWVNYADAPETFSYDRTFGPFTTDDCGEVTIVNTAEFTTDDSETSDESQWTVVITIPCPTGCTLTQGYWKTHSEYGPAPEDENWFNIGDVDGDGDSEGPDEEFFASGMSWYEVFWTAPKGGNAYYILAHQYMAAKLNIASPADSPASVDAAIEWAEDFFDGRDPSVKLSKTLRNEAIGYAGTLGSYNEGDIGPGHCSEDGAARSAG